MPADTSQPSLKEVLRQKRAEYILEVAEIVLLEKGYRDASMDEIAARAGVSKGTLYQHFPTKDDLIFALIDQSLVRFEQIVQQASVAPESAQSKLERILRAVHVEQYGVRTQLHRLLESNENISQEGTGAPGEVARSHRSSHWTRFEAFWKKGGLLEHSTRPSRPNSCSRPFCTCFPSRRRSACSPRNISLPKKSWYR